MLLLFLWVSRLVEVPRSAAAAAAAPGHDGGGLGHGWDDFDLNFFGTGAFEIVFFTHSGGAGWRAAAASKTEGNSLVGNRS